jgi:hypothetical protein
MKDDLVPLLGEQLAGHEAETFRRAAMNIFAILLLLVVRGEHQDRPNAFTAPARSSALPLKVTTCASSTWKRRSSCIEVHGCETCERFCSILSKSLTHLQVSLPARAAPERDEKGNDFGRRCDGDIPSDQK